MLIQFIYRFYKFKNYYMYKSYLKIFLKNKMTDIIKETYNNQIRVD